MGPNTECAFTTLPWDAGSHFANPEPYFARLAQHALRLGIPWPSAGLAPQLGPALGAALALERPEEAGLTGASLSPPGLLRVELHATGEVRATLRRLAAPAPEPWRAVCCLAPWFGAQATGTKHGNWNAYRDATSHAQAHGSAVCLLLRDGCVIDGDRCTPVVLLRSCPAGADGAQGRRVVWRPPEGAGAVHSVTIALMEPYLNQAGFEVQEGSPLSLKTLQGAEEVLVVGSGVGVRPVCAVDGEAVGSREGPFLRAARAALHAARSDGWYSMEATVQAAGRQMSPPRRKQWPAPQEDWFMPSVAQALLGGRLWGPAAPERGWAPDQLLLHSGGPTSDVAEYSMLAGPPAVRFKARQPAAAGDGASCSDVSQSRSCKRRRHLSSLSGHIPLLEEGTAGRPELQWSVEMWSTRQWALAGSTMGAQSLTEALRGVASAALLRDLPKPPPLGEEDKPQLPVHGSSIAGLLGYDLVQWTEPLHLCQVAEPDELIGVLYRMDRWLVHDRVRGTLWLLAPPGDVWASAVERLLDKCCATLRPPSPQQRQQQQQGAVCVVSAIDDAEHEHAVRTVQAAIRAGQLYQLNFGRPWTGPLREAPWELMQRLFLRNPAPFSAFLQVPDERFALCSSSPEVLLCVKGGAARTCPIKGTCKRGANAEEDARLRREMMGSQKEIAEHLMLVDLERHDLGRVCKAGSVTWECLRVESFPKVQHIVSCVHGQLRAAADSWEALGALFPGGSITGCPKTVTIATIDELEPVRRSFWTGSMGYVDLLSGDSQWNILIRTLEAHKAGPDGNNDCGWTATVKAGGGLTIGSEPAAEVEEAKSKAASLLHAAFGEAAAATCRGGEEEGVGQHPVEPVNAHVMGLLAALTEAAHRGESMEEENGRRGKGWCHWSRSGPPLPPTPCRAPGATAACRMLFVDNLDSFSLNIVNACAVLGAEVVMVDGRGSGCPSVDEVLGAVQPTHVLLGPGPGRPDSCPLTMALARRALAGMLGVPLLGVCLGHQALGLACGWDVMPSPLGAVHGVPESVHHDGRKLFAGLPSPVCMMRYNSLVMQPPPGPTVQGTPEGNSLEIAAWDETRTLVMAVRHATLPVCGVQFHPESAGSRGGVHIFDAFFGLTSW